VVSGDTVNILVVDDLPDKLLVLRSILEEPGQNVVAARSGEEALRRVLENDFAVILLDVNMPGMDGFETAGLIRRRKKSAHTPIIFLTAYADEVHTAQGYSLGAVDYILTPVVPEVLRTKVRAFVELHRMTQQARRQANERVALAREQAARAAAEEATRRSAFLAEASRVLAGSLEPATTLRGLARCAIGFLADFAAALALDERGKPGQAELAWAAEGPGRTRTEADTAWLPASLAAAVERLLENRQPQLLAELGTPLCLPRPGGEQANGDPGATEFGSALMLPLLARGRLLGVLVLGHRGGGRHYGPDDLVLADDLAGRAAIALDNARLHQSIQEADRRKDEFLAMLAHELRNPLAPVRNAVELLRRARPGDAILERAREIIDRQAMHMSRLVDELLDVSRLARGKVLLRQELLDLAEVVRATAEDYRGPLDAHGHKLLVRLPDRPVYVRGDRTRLAQVVGNVLHNADKFSESGGEVAVTVEADPTHGAVVTVRDRGAGIDPQMLPRVFEPFSQADRSLDRSRGGLGLGLTLVKGLVELHGGKVQVKSAGLGKGTEVVIRLPAEAGVAPWQAGPARAVSLEGKLRILIIEDNADAAESLAILFNLKGHEVTTARTGAAGLDVARANCPDFVLCDIGLPGGMDGYAVARALRRESALASAYLVATTGYGRAEDQRCAREAGFDAHLTKPVDFETLESVLAGLQRRAAVVA
jgi:signal transduction histidine kinase/DNA-binding response OmpR family regulator